MSSDRAMTAGPRRRGDRRCRRRQLRGGPVASLGVHMVLGLAVLGLVMVAAVAAPARAQDDSPDDAPVEDGRVENPEESDSEPPECPPRPPSPFMDAGPYPDDWCQDPRHWIVEVVCGPPHAGAGSTVRFNADPDVVGQLTLDDVCGGLGLAVSCRAPGRELPGTGEPHEEPVGTPGLGESPDGAAGVPGTAESPAAETGGGAVPTPFVGDGTGDACAPLWPPGAWFSFTSRDPISGSTASEGRHTGLWLGPRHWTAAVVPSLGLRCPGERLEAHVHTGGALTRAYGHGIPVDYRIGGSVRFQEWAGFAAATAGPGVSLPAWFADDFAGLLAANTSGEFHFRLYGPYGAEFGTAVFDLAAISEAVQPMREHCPALPPAPTGPDSEAAAPGQEEG